MSYVVYAMSKEGSFVTNAQNVRLHHVFASLQEAIAKADSAVGTPFGASVRTYINDVAVKGTTFEGRQQRIAVAIAEGTLKTGVELRVERYEYENAPAARLYIGDIEIGNLPAATSNWLRDAKEIRAVVCGIYGGTADKPNYGIRLNVCGIMHTVSAN